MSVSIPESIAFAALGHDARLSIFRLLVKAGEDGLTVGEIGRLEGLAASTLAHHLSVLVDAGLVAQERRGRAILNRASFAAARRLAEFVLSECCVGVVPAKITSMA